MDELRPTRNHRGWGLALMAAGGYLLARQLGWLDFRTPDLIAPALLFLGGLGFLALFSRDRSQWWFLIPGFAMLGIGTQAAADELLPRALIDGLEGLLPMGGIGLGFLTIFLAQREQWWALIPGGAILTIGFTSVFDQLGGNAGPAVFFLGMAGTFAMVWRLAGQSWAIWPMSALLAMGALMTASTVAALPWLTPLLLIGGGLWLIGGARGRERLGS